MPPIVIAGAIAAGGSIAGGLISSSAANRAAQTQAQSANYSAYLNKQAADEALAFQKQVYGTQQQQLYPWLQAGTSGIVNLASLLGLPMQGIAASTVPVAGPTGTIPYGQQNLQDLLDADIQFSDPRANVMARRLIPRVASKLYQQRTEAGGDPGGYPYLPQTTGTTAPLSSLVNPSLGVPGELMQPFSEQFQAPTNVTEQNDPGFQFRLEQGQKALERSAAARGNLLTGGTAKAIQQYGQDYASNEYQNVYNRAYNEYATRYNQWNQSQADRYNRLASLAGVGQTTAGQLGMIGQNTAGNVSNILMGSAGQIGNQLNNAAAARASGYVGGANALGGALSGSAGNIGNMVLLSQLLKGGGGLPINTYDPVTGTYPS